MPIVVLLPNERARMDSELVFAYKPVKWCNVIVRPSRSGGAKKVHPKVKFAGFVAGDEVVEELEGSN